jgi:uncharacterized membrane protein YoaK (UPF0700 family)
LKRTKEMTVLLTAVAGYCDAATFIAADNIFSAHVTGNFILFAVTFVVGSFDSKWAALLAFPVFIIAVIVGGWLAKISANKFMLLVVEGFLLMACGVLAFAWRSASPALGGWLHLGVTMAIVFAIGLQNAFSKLYSDETFGPTTVMTGNVTQLALDLGKLKQGAADRSALNKGLLVTGTFLCGCLGGSLLAAHFGLMAVGIPGIVLLAYFLRQ